MGDRVRVVHDDSGRLVAAKAPPPDDPERGRREADLLRGLHHPGVVELVGLVEEAGTPEVRTRWVGSRSTADLARPLPPVRAAGLVVAVAATVRDLHRLGVVHGALDPSHVLLDPYGRPVLCGFGDARRLDTPDAGGDAARPSDDVAGLGRLLAALLHADDGAASGGRPTEGEARAQRGDRRTRAQRRALLGVAAQATADDPACRPGVQAFVDAVRHAVPEAALGRPWDARATTDDPGGDAAGPNHGTDDPTDPLTRLLAEVEGNRSRNDCADAVPHDPVATAGDLRRRPDEPPPRDASSAGAAGGATRVVIDSPRAGDPVAPAEQLFGDLARLRPADDERHRTVPLGPLAAVGGVAALALAAFFGVSTVLGGTSSAGTSSAGAPSAASSASTTLPRPDPTVTAAPSREADTAPTTSPTTSPPAPTVDQGVDGSQGPDQPPEGATVVEHGGRRYAVGGPGDVVAVGDWHCTGHDVPAVLRPATGALFVFWSWPSPGTPHATEAATTVTGGVALREGAPDRAGCTPLVVTDAQGSPTAFDSEAWR